MDPASEYQKRLAKEALWTEEEWAEEHRRRDKRAEESRKKFELEKQRQHEVLEHLAGEIGPSLKRISKARTTTVLLEIHSTYSTEALLAGSVESASRTKWTLQNLAEKAEALLEASLMLGEGAVEIMSRDEVWRIGAPGEQGKSEFEPDDPLGPQWIAGLEKLGKIAREKVNQVEKEISKGGRKSLWTRLHGLPEEWLAQDCKEFAESHGCRSQAVILKMVQVILELTHGKDAMKKMDGRPSDKGRKAVRKVASPRSTKGSN